VIFGVLIIRLHCCGKRLCRVSPLLVLKRIEPAKKILLPGGRRGA
jgi:hypothetical protein